MLVVHCDLVLGAEKLEEGPLAIPEFNMQQQGRLAWK